MRTRSPIMKEQTVWPGNYNRYRTALEQGFVYGIATTGKGLIIAEVRSAQKMRLVVLANPQTMTVIHRCNAESGAPCWHLALGLEMMAYAGQRRLVVHGKRPVAVVNAVDRCVRPEDVGRCRDITDSFCKYVGLPQSAGDFKLIKTIKRTPVNYDGSEEHKRGFWENLKDIFSLVGGIVN